MSLEDWANNGWLRPHKSSAQEIAGLLAIVEHDLARGTRRWTHRGRSHRPSGRNGRRKRNNNVGDRGPDSERRARSCRSHGDGKQSNAEILQSGIRDGIARR